MQKFKMNFLAAADGTALTKQYTKEDDGTISVAPYPFVKRFNSFEYEIGSLDDWLEVLKAHSDKGHCFLKGLLDKKLEGESRAGHTSQGGATRTMLLDLDFNDGFRDVEDFLYQLDPMFAGVSYILQHSNSAGITGPSGLRAHLGFIFDKPVNPAYIKTWLQHKNLTVPALSRLITLSANGLSLKYPLDVTTCQNDKIIYTARPQCTNFEDPLADERIVLIGKDLTTLTKELPFIKPELIQQQVDDKVTELREDEGLKAKKVKYSAGRGEQILLNPDRAAVTSVRNKPGKWTHLNLNNGDSWGYYHDKENPHLLYNFKGEPPCRLKDIVPEYYASLIPATGDDAEIVPLVFRDRERDQYYNLLYNSGTKEIDSLDMVGSKDRMRDFMEQHNAPLPDPIEDWRVQFDPRTTEVYQEQHKWINSYKPTEFIKTDYLPQKRIPYVIDKVLTSICVDEEYKKWFVNWLVYVYQNRDKSMVAPLFHGVQGTGKGLLHEKILRPLLGEDHCPKLTTQQIKDPFNGWIERAIIGVWDEAEQMNAFDNTTYDKVKNLISEPHGILRLMRQNPITIRNFANLLVFTNHPFPFPLSPGDRRFCVAPAQLNMLEITRTEVDAIADELEIFAAFLQHQQVRTEEAVHILYNEARNQMITGSANTVDMFFYALRDGDIDYFLGFLKDQVVVTPDPIYNEFVRILRRWANDVDKTGKTIVSRDEAMTAFSYIVKRFDSPAKFKKMGEKYHIEWTRGMINNKQRRGWHAPWKTSSPEVLESFLAPDVTSIKAAS